MARSMNDMITKAQNVQEERLINFGAVGLSSGGGAFKADEYFRSAKRFKRVWQKGSAAAVCASTVLQDATLEITIPEDRWASVGAVVIELYNETAVVWNGKVCGQFFRLAKLEIVDPNGKSLESGSLRAHTFGVEQVQGEADEIEMSAAPFRALNEHLIDGDSDFTMPLAFLNPGETIKMKITGLQGTTAADSFTGSVYAVPHICYVAAIKG